MINLIEDIVDVICAFLFSCIFLDILIIIVKEPSILSCFHIILLTNIVFLIKMIIL